RRDHPMKPQVVAWELGQRLRNDAVVTCDSGTIATWWARHIPARRGQLSSLSGTLATMANGFPYAIAAQVAFPERQCVAFVGDDGFSMLMAEFVNCVKYRLPVKVVVIKTNTLGQIEWEQMVFLGNPEYGCELQPVVGLEPSCMSVFRDELPNLLPDDEDARRLAEQIVALDAFLLERGVFDGWPRLAGRAVVHGHCHRKSLSGMDGEREALAALGLDVTVLDSGCCGMAGAGRRYPGTPGERPRMTPRGGTK
ncbi:MAG: thiamine pyrophosphate-dependent enzyme, partial [Candidatus Rokuibacteriota bacterium]